VLDIDAFVLSSIWSRRRSRVVVKIPRRLDDAFDLDRRQRELADQRDRLRNEIGVLSKQVGQLHREGRKGEAVALQERSRELGEDEKRVATEGRRVGPAPSRRVAAHPQHACRRVPDGAGEDDNVVLRTHGFDVFQLRKHQRKPHWDIAHRARHLGHRTGRPSCSGSMFVMYRGFGATLVRRSSSLRSTATPTRTKRSALRRSSRRRP
jgi:seryl-tRNA synthetase